MKRQVIDQRKIFAKYIPDKELVPKIYKEILQLNKTTHCGGGMRVEMSKRFE